MDWGAYDTTVYDRRTPQGQADNTDPYGMLVGGYGICLGYATTFQLLMDLAGVECITVVGAAADSTEDHAWNMVRLEGEWYCVDPTWDDNSHDTSVKSRHRYFNVTSDHMAQTNHQWDYENTPEAIATRFRWDGTGPLPQ
jgi:transglutaminase/protease-like cytokinesis protein 3